MRITRERLSIIFYIVALVLLLGTSAWLIVGRQFDIYCRIGYSLTAMALAVGIFLDPERVRRALTGRQARFGSNAILLSLAFIGILAAINYLLYNNPVRWDLTEDQEYTLAPETVLVLEQLQEPVLIKGFYTPDSAGSRDQFRPLLEEYKARSDGKVDFEFVDPLENPVAADQYGITRDGSLAVLVGDASEVIDYPSESEITSAIVRLTNPGERKVAFLIGHGERDLESTDDSGYSQAKSSLEAKNYEVVEVSLLASGEIPPDTLVLVVAGPRGLISQEEADIIQAYLEGGGSLVLLYEPLLDPSLAPQNDALLSYLKEQWGITVEQDLVVDLNSTMPLSGISYQYGVHPITERMQNMASYFPSASSLEVGQATDVGLTPLVLTGDRSWGETDIEGLIQGGSLAFSSESDKPGPLTLAVVAENYASGARLVVVGDSDFAANADFFGLANGDLFINSVDWAAKQENLINLTPKDTTQRLVVPPSVEAVGIIFLVVVILMPGAVIGFGISVWVRRRRRA
jgi:ABC-type uncharacterized transport system involved in gliding motility auxiliary subunit